jgi:uncharacterized paraquat-inducible protein A
MTPDDPLKVLGDLLKSAQQTIAPEALARANEVQMSQFKPPGDWQTFARQSSRIICPSCHALNTPAATVCGTCQATLPPA